MKQRLYEGKKILITQSTLCAIAGSEIVALELAKYIKGEGGDVAIFTWVYDEPIRKYVEEAGIKVITEEEHDFFKECDYIWVHHQVLPEQIMELLYNEETYNPQIFFFHMSGKITHYMEQPYISGLEECVATKRLFVSVEAQEAITEMFYADGSKIPEYIYPNPFPMEYGEKRYARMGLKRILVVSNHPPKEIINIRNIDSDIKIDYVGELSNKYELITRETLLQYDVVITIGKTVQYCLALGVPVYVYDHFGGCGYLNLDNFDECKKHNFSGRNNNGEGNKKTSREILEEIINEYNLARKYQSENLDSFRKQFAINENVKTIFMDNKNTKKRIKMSESKYREIRAMASMAKWKFIAEHNVNILTNEKNSALEELDACKEKNKSLTAELNKMNKIFVIRAMRKAKIIK